MEYIVEFISYEMQYRADDACDFTEWIDDIVSTFFKCSQRTIDLKRTKVCFRENQQASLEKTWNFELNI